MSSSKMNFKLNKKGVGVLLMLFEIAAALVVVYILANIAVGIGSSKAFVKASTAKDMALLVDTLIAAPGDVIVYYNRDTSPYVVSAVGTSFFVSEEDEQKASGYFIPFEGLELKKEINHNRLIYLYKMGQDFGIGEGPVGIGDLMPNKIPLVEAATKQEDWENKEIVITPESINGEQNILGDIIVKDINQISKEQTAELRDLKDLSSADMIIELNINNQKQGSVMVRVSTEGQLRKNKKLAALIINNLVKEDKDNIIKTKNIVLVDNLDLLDNSDTAVSVEISLDVKDKLGNKIAEAVSEAIKEYYN